MTRARCLAVPLLIAVWLGAPAAASALHAGGPAAPGALQAGAGGVSFSLGASAGVAEGTASEFAFYYPFGTKFKLSELTWDLKDVAIGGVQASVGFGRRLRLNLGVWSALSEGTGMMVDRDWDYPESFTLFVDPGGDNWTHESRHPDTTLERGIVLDQNLSLLALQRGAFALAGVVGFKYENWKWSARGGTFVYSADGFRDTVGSFTPGVLVIEYEQRYLIPYVGLSAGFSGPALQVETHLHFSPVVSATDTDYHALRGVTFEGSFVGGVYLGAGLSAVWRFVPRWYAALAVEYQTIPEIVGDVTITGSEGSGFFGSGGGLAMSMATVTAGAGYRF